MIDQQFSREAWLTYMSPSNVVSAANLVWNGVGKPGYYRAEETDQEVYFPDRLERAEILEELEECGIAVINATESGLDLLLDLLALYPAGVHLGFLTAALSIQDRVFAMLAQARADGVPAILTGHSLGGAVAQVLAWRWSVDHPGAPKAWVYTTGAPRPFAGRLARDIDTWLGVRWINFQAAGDPVPGLPFWGRPVGQSVKGLRGSWWDRFGLTIGNHFPANYDGMAYAESRDFLGE